MRSIILALFVFVCGQMFSQIKVTGVVTDEANIPMPSVNILVKGTVKGVVTDFDGKYSIEVKDGDVLDFSFVGYLHNYQKISAKRANRGVLTLNVVMKEDAQQLSDVVVVGYGVQKKESVVSSVSTIKADQLKIPTRSFSNGLSGQIAGFIAIQRSGEPGYDDSEFYIRGISSFAGGTRPLVLVDGVPRGMADIEPDEIETFTLLKDAAATAVYGAQGANGVILITSKKGSLKEKTKISFRAETTTSSPTKLPEFLRSVDYMNLYNEALENEGRPKVFSDELIEKYVAGTDRDLYPDVRWLDLLKDKTYNSRYTLNFRGGGERTRYFISGSYYNESGLFKNNPKGEYQNNIGIQRYNLRTNVDLALTNTTKLGVSLSGQYLQNIYPGVGTAGLFQLITRTPPNLFPMIFSDGRNASHPRPSGNRKNPYNELMESGYAKEWKTYIQSSITFNQDLDFITNGLSFRGLLSYDADSELVGRRNKTVAQYTVDFEKGGRDADGNLILKQQITESPISGLSSDGGINKKIYIEASLDYKKAFGKHNITGQLLYNQRDSQSRGNLIAYRKQGYVGRAVYAYDRRYSLEANFGFTGSETFAEKNRFGFFPAIGVAWVVDNEPFYKGKISEIVNGLKFRVSYGRTGNDATGGDRFLYRPTFDQHNNHGYHIGMNNGGGTNHMAGIIEGRFAAPNLGWEIEDKQNYGIDLALFDNRITLQADYFFNKRHNILLRRNLVPGHTGFRQNPWQNFGRVNNWGVDASLQARTKINEVGLSMKGTFTFARNKIIERDEIQNKYDWMNQTGQRLRTHKLYIAEGLLTHDDFDITTNDDGRKVYKLKDHIPTSTMEANLRPGDIKYQDLNGDGVIDQYDQKYSDWHPTTPEINYGVGFNVDYKNFYLNVFFQGAANVTTRLGGHNAAGFFPFAWGVEEASLRAEALNRWTEANPSQNVLFPRLRSASNNHNQAASTWWLRDASFLRFKNLEIGYNVPKKWLDNLGVGSARIYMLGNNLYVWDSIKMWDPEIGNANAGLNYPLQRTFTFGLELSL